MDGVVVALCVELCDISEETDCVVLVIFKVVESVDLVTVVDCRLGIVDVSVETAVVVFLWIVVVGDVVVCFCGFCVELGGNVVVLFGSGVGVVVLCVVMIVSLLVVAVGFSVTVVFSLGFIVENVVSCSVVLASLLGSAVVNVVSFSVVLVLSLDSMVVDVMDCSVVFAFVLGCSVIFVSCFCPGVV